MNINNFIFLCVGDTTVLFDSLGGVVGDLLKSKNIPAPVFGGSDFCITTKNIKQVVDCVKQVYKDKKIVIIDCTCTDVNLTNNNLNFEYNFLTKETILKKYAKQKIELKQGVVNIANINYECGDYNILCETFFMLKNKIYSINFKDVLLLANRIVDKIFDFFKI